MSKLTPLGSFFFFILFCSSIANAQAADSSKVRLAVLPFVAPTGAAITNPGDIVTIQDIVTSEFTSLSRFIVLDRSKFQAIIDELHIQSSEQFLNGRIVDQGRQEGAQYLVTGVVTEFRVARTQHANLKHPNQPIISYAGSLKMSFGVINVQSGQSLFTNQITISASDPLSLLDSTANARAALSKLKDEVNKQIKLILASQISIQQLGQLDRDGLPKTILTNGGGDIIKPGDRTRVTISLVDKVGDYVRYVKIGELYKPTVENQIVEWEISHKDAKAVADAFNAHTQLVVNIDNTVHSLIPKF